MDMIIHFLLRHAQRFGDLFPGFVSQPVEDENLTGLFGQLVERFHHDPRNIFGENSAITRVLQRLYAGRDLPVIQLRIVLSVLNLNLKMLQVVQAFVLDRKQNIPQHVRIGGQPALVLPIIQQRVVCHVLGGRQIVDIIVRVPYEPVEIIVIEPAEIRFRLNIEWSYFRSILFQDKCPSRFRGTNIGIL